MTRAVLAAFVLASGLPASVHFDLPGTDGARHQSDELRRSRATVLVFLATDCPISNRYSPVLRELDQQYRSQGITFYGVFAARGNDADAVRKHLTDFELPFPALLDPSTQVAHEVGANVTPEVAVLSPQGEVLYRGRIDNRYVDWGKIRPVATEHDLRDVLEAVLAGKPILHPVTKALGCAISPLP